MKAHLFAFALALSLSPAPASAENAIVSSLIREACKSATAKTKYLDTVEESRGKEERAIVAFDIERDCAHIGLSDTPEHDTADPAPEASHSNWVHDVRYSADGKSILSASRDGSVRVWSTETGKQISRIELPSPKLPEGWPQHAAYIRSAVFLGDGSRIALAQDFGPVLVFETATGNQINTPPADQKIDSAPLIAAAADGSLLVGPKGNLVLAVDPVTRETKYKLDGHGADGARSMAVSAEAGLVATAVDGGRASTVMLWKLANGEKAAEIKRERRSPHAMAFSRDGERLAVAYGGTATVFDTTTQKELQSIMVHPMYSIMDLAFTADGNGLITCQGYPILWDVSSGKLVRHFGPFNDLCHAIDVSPDGKFAVSGSMGSDIRIWEIETGAFERRLGARVDTKG